MSELSTPVTPPNRVDLKIASLPPSTIDVSEDPSNLISRPALLSVRYSVPPASMNIPAIRENLALSLASAAIALENLIVAWEVVV
jgi:hypothetical protein